MSRRRTTGTPKHPGAAECRKKFLRFFPGGFQDEKYAAWERGYKWEAHEQWNKMLDRAQFEKLLRAKNFSEVAARAVRLESKTNLLFSFEKMALRDAVKPPAGAQRFAEGLYDFIYGPGRMEEKFERWTGVIGKLPRKQTRVLTWPVVTVFGFIARPDRHIFLKPKVTRIAARKYEFDFQYASRPAWQTYASLLKFSKTVQDDLGDLHPRDFIDIQSFLWVQGSEEYPG